MTKIGLHLRITTNFIDMLEKAFALQLPIFQCFLIHQYTGNYVEYNKSTIAHFSRFQDYFVNTYLHGSYYINLAKTDTNHQPLLNREINLAKYLGFNNLILHIGAYKANVEKMEAIDTVVRVLNKTLKQENDLTIILENSAHGNKSLGGDLFDLYLIKSKIDYPEKLKFCIDTAHAYVYGYDITNNIGLQDFLEQIDAYLGLNNISLIHLNDTEEKLGSKIDCHSILGQGNLGVNTLKNFINHPLWHIKNNKDVPIILELPMLPERQEIEALALVSSWKNKPSL